MFPICSAAHRRYVIAVIFEIGYGRTISTLDDDFIRLVERGVNESLSGGSSSGGAMVDLFPIREHHLSVYASHVHQS